MESAAVTRISRKPKYMISSQNKKPMDKDCMEGKGGSIRSCKQLYYDRVR